MHRVRASTLQRLAAAAAVAPSAAAVQPLHAAGALAARQVRAMSAGSKRNKKEGIPERKAGGITLPGEDETDRGGKRRYKSSKELDRDEERSQRQSAASGEGYTAAERRKAFEDFEADRMNPEGTAEERDIVAATEREFAEHMASREPLRAGEQLWRERQLARAGIAQQPDFKAAATTKILRREAAADPAILGHRSANPRNPVLIRTRAHLNPADLPPSFDHFNVPPLAAAEVDAKEKALHASYWSKYAAWKDARPAEYERWLARLKKREQEQDYHWFQAQLAAKEKKKDAKNGGKVEEEVEALHERAVGELLPSKHREAFSSALAADPALQEAVASLGQEEVLRRWGAYQVFLDAELTSQDKHAAAEQARLKTIQRNIALDAEDPVRTLNDPALNLTLEQRKKIYRTLLGAKKKTQEVPFWTDPDPRNEGEHDWKMADAFIKPPILPPLHLLRAYSARQDTDSNFSSLHKFLHFERLRQTITFLKESKKKAAREKVRATRDVAAHLEGVIANSPRWPHIAKTYPFLSDALYNGLRGLHLAPWAQKDQVDFLDALHRQVVLIARLLDSHFSRRNRNASWILSYPRNARDNPDEVLRSMTVRDVRKMEAEVLAQQLMQQLTDQPEMVEQLEAAMDSGDKQ